MRTCKMLQTKIQRLPMKAVEPQGLAYSMHFGGSHCHCYLTRGLHCTISRTRAASNPSRSGRRISRTKLRIHTYIHLGPKTENKGVYQLCVGVTCFGPLGTPCTADSIANEL